MPLYGYGPVKKTVKGPWVIPEKPNISPPGVKAESESGSSHHHHRHHHSSQFRRSRVEEEEAEEEARLVYAEYNAKLLEARAWREPLTLPPFLPILYSDYILDEPRTIWRYDARDWRGGADRQVVNTWATLKVRPVEERMGGREGMHMVDDGRGTSREGGSASGSGEVKVKEEEDGAGRERDTVAKAVEEDEKNLKILVKNLAERGAVCDSCIHTYKHFFF